MSSGCNRTFLQSPDAKTISNLRRDEIRWPSKCWQIHLDGVTSHICLLRNHKPSSLNPGSTYQCFIYNVLLCCKRIRLKEKFSLWLSFFYWPLFGDTNRTSLSFPKLCFKIHKHLWSQRQPLRSCVWLKLVAGSILCRECRRILALVVRWPDSPHSHLIRCCRKLPI